MIQGPRVRRPPPMLWVPGQIDKVTHIHITYVTHTHTILDCLNINSAYMTFYNMQIIHITFDLHNIPDDFSSSTSRAGSQIYQY